MTFRERYMAGETDFEEIFDLTDDWNFGDYTCTLREFLGLNEEEEDIWISDSDEALEDYMIMERSRKIFFTDLDGTLLNDKKEVSAETGKLLSKIRKDDHIVTITTGRALASAIVVAKELKLWGKGVYIICFNGGQIYDTEHDKIIYSRSIPFDLVRFCFDEAAKAELNIQTYSNTAVINEHMNDSIKTYAEVQKIPFEVVDDVTKALAQEPAKSLAVELGQSEKVVAFRNHLAPLVEGKLDLFLSQPEYLEIVPTGVSKGEAVRFLCDYLGVPIKNTVAAGDAENDIPMLQAAGVGAAMKNANDDVKQHADYITANDNNNEGAAEIIRKFILN